MRRIRHVLLVMQLFPKIGDNSYMISPTYHNASRHEGSMAGSTASARGQTHPRCSDLVRIRSGRKKLRVNTRRKYRGTADIYGSLGALCKAMAFCFLHFYLAVESP